MKKLLASAMAIALLVCGTSTAGPPPRTVAPTLPVVVRPVTPTPVPRPIPPVTPPVVTRPATITQAPTARPNATTLVSPSSRASPAVGRVNGNSLTSNASQTQYGIFRTPTGQGKTTLFKTGISGSTNRLGNTLSTPQRSTLSELRTYNSRALNQVRALNNDPAKTENGRYLYSTRNFKAIEPQPNGSTPSRALIAKSEQQTVTMATAKNNGTPPTGNVLPKPYAASYLNKK